VSALPKLTLPTASMLMLKPSPSLSGRSRSRGRADQRGAARHDRNVVARAGLLHSHIAAGVERHVLRRLEAAACDVCALRKEEGRGIRVVDVDVAGRGDGDSAAALAAEAEVVTALPKSTDPPLAKMLRTAFAEPTSIVLA
jgi:hypothetical protein